jgi:outer membrane protein OmpA-like peptidoglycan-associated protein
MAAPAAALAQPITGPYVSLGGAYDLEQVFGEHTSPGGFNQGQSDSLINGAAPTSGETKSRYHSDSGFGAQGSVGYGLGNGLRVELEGLYLYDNINHRGGTQTPGVTSGRSEAYGPMVNVLYDFDLGQFGIQVPVTPYIGVGAGYLWDHLSPLSTTYTNGDFNRVGGTEGSLAYQGIVGIAYNIPPVPGLAVTLDYRFIGQSDLQSFKSIAYTPNGPHTVNSDFNDLFHHEVMVGVRYAFNSAPPPPPPAPVVQAPAPAPARTYLVFFDWDKSYLTPRARQIVAEAAQNSTRTQTTTIEVNGYADTSHALPGERGQQYNLRLSLRRADSVKAELIRDGVPANVIEVHGYGDSHLLVQTGPNVREPQNRRVEIILH